MDRRLEEWVAGIRAADRTVLGQAITLLESRRPDHAELGQRLLNELLPFTGNAHRIGVTGVPGVGKSTLIEALGIKLLERKHRVAVLAIDPSSTVSGGSILGDKSRMERLAQQSEAFIRPSPSAKTLGGVGRRTREAMLLCEAAGFDIIFVETVGVGQSETIVAGMVDSFLFLALPGAGDELQGIKRGIVELADLVAVNKADGDQLALAQSAAVDFQNVLHFLRPRSNSWSARVHKISSLKNEGLDELWTSLQEHRAALVSGNELDGLRQSQRRQWMWGLLEERLITELRSHPKVAEILPAIEARVDSGTLAPSAAASELLRRFTASSE